MNLCFQCGLPRLANRRRCPHCSSPYCLAPDLDEIAAACAVIRLKWSAVRLSRNELDTTLEVTESHKVGDHMRRKPRQED